MEDLTKHYIQNDGKCPLPVSGRRVTVGFWAIAGVPEGTRPKPELFTPQPLFTIVYPAGQGNACYNWSHYTGNESDPLHPNSARAIEWKDGHVELLQYTQYGCLPDSVVGPSGKAKSMFWELFQDWPQELWGRIVSVQEITTITPRESCVIRLRAGDGHWLSLSPDSKNGDITCGNTLITNDCDFVARFPGYVWNNAGGTGDTGAFALQASNGKFLRRPESSGAPCLQADTNDLAKATLFEATIMNGCNMALKAGGQYLRHDPPYAALCFADGLADPFTYFNASYV